MALSKKLQVFVSSTYLDLREERQAAVEAILSSGHIPAGMELFAAGDESQMSVIHRWIDESDVFLLILGGRYGSLEPLSGKSYTHLEYEYALEKSKPLFAVVIDDVALEKRVRKGGRKTIEIENSQQLKKFRELVLRKMVKFWRDERDIKLAIHETLGEFSRRSDLTGWIPGDQAISVGLLAEEIARLTKENADLRQQLTQASTLSVTYNGLRFEEFVRLLTNQTVDVTSFRESKLASVRAIPDEFGSNANLLDVFWGVRDEVMGGKLVRWMDPVTEALTRLEDFGLLTSEEYDVNDNLGRFRLTPEGQKLILRLLAERTANSSEDLAS